MESVIARNDTVSKKRNVKKIIFHRGSQAPEKF